MNQSVRKQAKTARTFVMLCQSPILVCLLCGCDQASVPFDTIERHDSIYDCLYQETTPKIVVLTHPSDIALRVSEVLPTTRQQLVDMDWEARFAIIAFQGIRWCSNHGVTIERITIQGHLVSVYARFHAPGPEQVVRETCMSGYHAVSLPRDAFPIDQTFSFLLLDRDEPMAQTLATILDGPLPSLTPSVTATPSLAPLPSRPSPTHTPSESVAGTPHPTLTSIPPTPTPTLIRESEVVLRYVAEREGIPFSDLTVANQGRHELPLLGKTYWTIKAYDTVNDRLYMAMVDLDDGSFVDDLSTIQRAEGEARHALYGNIEPQFYEQLQEIEDDKTIRVIIGVAGEPRRSREEAEAILMEKYPEAREAEERTGNIFAVGDYEMGERLEAEYTALRKPDNDYDALSAPPGSGATRRRPRAQAPERVRPYLCRTVQGRDSGAETPRGHQQDTS